MARKALNKGWEWGVVAPTGPWLWRGSALGAGNVVVLPVGVGCGRLLSVLQGGACAWSSGQYPGPVLPVQAAVDECAEIDCRTTGSQPGVVLVDAEVA